MKKMNRISIIQVLGLVLLCGCTKVDIQSPEQLQGAVRFNEPVISGLAKATGEISGQYPTDESMGVFSIYHTESFSGWNNGTIYIDRGEFSYDSSVDDEDADELGGWTGGYFFPKNGYLSFAAYSPFRAHSDTPGDGTGKFTYGSAGLTIEDFSVPSEAANQYDLMYAERIYDRQNSTGIGDGYEGMDLVFHHALASVKFKVQQSDVYTGTTIRLKKISIYNVCYQGDFSENVDESSPAYASSPEWTVETSYLIEASDAYIAFHTSETQDLKLTDHYPTATEPLLPLDEVSGQNDLLLMPQVFKNAGGIQNDLAVIKVEYTVQSGAGPMVNQQAEVKIHEISDTWEMGKRYIYNISIGLDKITFGPTVSGWTDVTVPSVTI